MFQHSVKAEPYRIAENAPAKGRGSLVAPAGRQVRDAHRSIARYASRFSL